MRHTIRLPDSRLPRRTVPTVEQRELPPPLPPAQSPHNHRKGNTMNKTITTATAICLMLLALTACQQQHETTTPTPNHTGDCWADNGTLLTHTPTGHTYCDTDNNNRYNPPTDYSIGYLNGTPHSFDECWEEGGNVTLHLQSRHYVCDADNNNRLTQPDYFFDLKQPEPDYNT